MKASTKKRAIWVAVGLGISALVLAAAVQGPFRRNVERELKPGTLPYLAKELKEKGVTKHKLPVAAIIEYPYPVNGLDQLLTMPDAVDAVVVATLLDQRYRMSMDLERIETVAKFRVDEFLSGTILRPRGQVPAARMPPGAKPLAPLKEDEILVLRGGGALMVNGVLFRQPDYGFPPFEIGRQYLLLLSAKQPRPEPGNHYGDRNVRFYLPSLGPHSVFLVEINSPFPAKLQTVALGPYFREELEQRFLSRKDFLVDHVRRIGRPPQVQWLEEQ